MTYTTILFDADGTLFDYDRAEAEALRSSLAAVDIALDAALLQAYREINRAAWSAFERGELTQVELRAVRFERLLATCERNGHDAAALGEAYLDRLSERGDLLAGAWELLDELHGKFTLAIITNGIARVQHSRMDRSGLRGYFDAIVISGEIGIAKPDPRIFDAALNVLGGPPRDSVLMVGDSLSSDIRGAHNANLDACWLRSADAATDGAGHAPRHEIEHLHELRAILE